MIYVIDLPLTVPAGLAAAARSRRARRTRRSSAARQVGEEYETVEVHPSVIRARTIGGGIVEAARARGVEMIVMGAEPPTRIKGGALLGGIGGAAPGRDRAGDRVRAPPGALPGAGDRAAERRLQARALRAEARRRDQDDRPRGRAARARVAATKISRMFVLIVGAGRVGSSVARSMLAEGHEVSCLDEDPESHARLEIGLDKPWEDMGGHFTVGTALELEALTAAGIERADVFVASTDGDNTNIVIAQIAKRRFDVPKVIARILDPYRAKWYAEQGLDTICPTRVAIDMLEQEIREAAERGAADRPQVGAVDHEDADV